MYRRYILERACGTFCTFRTDMDVRGSNQHWVFHFTLSVIRAEGGFNTPTLASGLLITTLRLLLERVRLLVRYFLERAQYAGGSLLFRV